MSLPKTIMTKSQQDTAISSGWNFVHMKSKIYNGKVYEKYDAQRNMGICTRISSLVFGTLGSFVCCPVQLCCYTEHGPCLDSFYLALYSCEGVEHKRVLVENPEKTIAVRTTDCTALGFDFKNIESIKGYIRSNQSNVISAYGQSFIPLIGRSGTSYMLFMPNKSIDGVNLFTLYRSNNGKSFATAHDLQVQCIRMCGRYNGSNFSQSDPSDRTPLLLVTTVNN